MTTTKTPSSGLVARDAKHATATTPEKSPAMNGAAVVIKALADQGVEVVFGYPGGAVLPIYDALFEQNGIRHILVRHEQGAVHAAEGYARSSGKVGVVLVTSGPGATNAVTGLTDALMDSIPIVCMTGQVPTHLIGNDAFQEADTIGITRPCTKHSYLVTDVDRLSHIMHEAFYVARSGRPGPVVIDLPKDIQQAQTDVIVEPAAVSLPSYQPQREPQPEQIEALAALIAGAKRPVFYVGGGVINAGPEASEALTAFVRKTGIPCTTTLMALGAYPASDKQFLGMLGMHGTYEANLAMYHADVLINIGARFDDRVTGKLDEFSPNSTKAHIDIDPSSLNKTVLVDLPIVADAGLALAALQKVWSQKKLDLDAEALSAWWAQIEQWRARKSLAYSQQKGAEIKPQHAIRRLYEMTQGRDTFISTEVGQHQMWAAQHFGFDKPNRWMTSGGLGTMGYGLPAAIGTQLAQPEALVVDIAGEASILMNIQEMSTAVQYRLPVKVFIINNQWMGMVRQWQQLLYAERYSESYTESLPDFVKLAEAFGALGLRATHEGELDSVIEAMLAHPGPVIADICVTKNENCFPMIPSGKPHYQMLLSEEDDLDNAIEGDGMVLV